MLTLQQIQTQAYATACEKGWHDRPLRELGLIAGGPNGDEREGFVIHHDRVLAKHALMHTELTEAHDCIVNGEWEMYKGDNDKPEGLPVEIADFVVRVCDTTKALGVDLPVHERWLKLAKHMSSPAEIQHALDSRSMEMLGVQWLALVRRCVDRATEAARVNAWDEYADKLASAILYAAGIVAGFGFDLAAAIEAKMSYNKSRPHRHGGKQA